MSKKQGYIIACCGVLYCMLLLFVCVLLLREQRNLFIAANAIVVIIVYFRFKRSPSYKITKKQLLCVAMLWTALLLFFNVFYSRMIREEVEGLRLQLLQTQYKDEVDALLLLLAGKDDTSYTELPENTVSPFLSKKGQAAYIKKNGSILLYFPTDMNFFVSYGYVFHTDASLLSLGYQTIFDYNEHWAYAKLY